jgi:peptidoglycan pentaglycine glycine transferase (the first glycine)
MKNFLQSNAWLDFQRSLGRRTWQIQGTSIIKYELRLGKSYLYSPRCGGNFLSESIIEKLKEIARQENVIFWKVEPENKIDLEKFGFKKSINIQPQKTLILDISRSEQELLGQMHYKTRYNIGLAEKKGIKIRKDKNLFNDFWELIQGTTKRDKFRPHPKEYYKKMLEVPGVELFVADYQNKIIAANITVFYEKTAIYLHGASDYEHRKLMAPYLLQREQIKEAKKCGCTEYDFWGIDEQKWPGVTRFKKGFNGREVEYPGAYDLVFQPIWYGIYKIARKIL